MQACANQPSSMSSSIDPGSACNILHPVPYIAHHLPSQSKLRRSLDFHLQLWTMTSVQAMAAVLLVAALLGCVLPSEAGRAMLVVGSEKSLSSLLPSCSPPPAPVDAPYTPTPDANSPTPDSYTPPSTPSEPSPVYSPPVASPPAGGY